MRGDIVYRVYGAHEGRDKDVFFGAFRTAAEAEAEIKKLRATEMYGESWAQRYHDKGFVIREAIVETDFEIPSLPRPRDKYVARTSPKPNRPGTWNSTVVEVCRRSASGELEKICEYERNYAMLQTFEPFRQGGRELALISRSYTKTAVLALATGEVIAEEPDEYYDQEQMKPGAGFCPVGFYVPDWWDVNDGSIIPGSEHWDADDEWPNGDFGFVWGCHWGDDSSWKVQHLDLSRVLEGVIARDERFGYVELATSGYRSPCIPPPPTTAPPFPPPHFIQVSKYSGRCSVTFAVEMAFDLGTGKSERWQRTGDPFG